MKRNVEKNQYLEHSFEAWEGILKSYKKSKKKLMYIFYVGNNIVII